MCLDYDAMLQRIAVKVLGLETTFALSAAPDLSTLEVTVGEAYTNAAAMDGVMMQVADHFRWIRCPVSQFGNHHKLCEWIGPGPEEQVEDDGIFTGLGLHKQEGISPDDIKMVWVEPETVDLVTTSETAGRSEFEAFVELKTGESYSLDLVSWEISNLSSGVISSEGTFTAVQTNGGITEVIAKLMGHEGKANVRVVYKENISVGDIDASIIDAFEAASPQESETPTLLYPYDGVTVSRNLDGLGLLGPMTVPVTGWFINSF